MSGISNIHKIKTNRGVDDERDLKLLQQVATKDKLAFETLYARYYTQLTRFLTKMLAKPTMVEEVVNDTLFVVWEKSDTFEGRSKVSTWITGIAYFKALKLLEKDKRSPEANAIDIDDAEPLADTADLIGRIGLRDWLEGGLMQISPEQKMVIELTYYQGLSYQEIALLMDCPVNTVKTRMFHARRQLAKLLPGLLVLTTKGQGESTSSHEVQSTTSGAAMTKSNKMYVGDM